MKTVTVEELRENLAELLGLATRGTRVVITDGGKWVAALTPPPDPPPTPEEEETAYSEASSFRSPTLAAQQAIGEGHAPELDSPLWECLPPELAGAGMTPLYLSPLSSRTPDFVMDVSIPAAWHPTHRGTNYTQRVLSKMPLAVVAVPPSWFQDLAACLLDAERAGETNASRSTTFLNNMQGSPSCRRGNPSIMHGAARLPLLACTTPQFPSPPMSSLPTVSSCHSPPPMPS